MIRAAGLLVEAQDGRRAARLRVAQARDLDGRDQLLHRAARKRIFPVRLRGIGGPGACRIRGKTQLGEHDRTGVVRRVVAGEVGVAVVAGAERLLLHAEGRRAAASVGAVVTRNGAEGLIRGDGDRVLTRVRVGHCVNGESTA